MKNYYRGYHLKKILNNGVKNLYLYLIFSKYSNNIEINQIN